MLKTTENENVELSAAKYENSEMGTYYIVFRWSNNTENLSVNGEASLLVFEGFDIDLDVKALYHTHPKSTGPSYNDAEISSKLNLPIYVLGLDGRVWETEKVLVLPGKEPFIKIKIGNMNSWRLDDRNPPYGTLINDINLIR